MDEVNYYEFLGVSEDASFDEIKHAFSQKRKEYRNDEQKTDILNRAYATFKNEETRKEYNINLNYGEKLSILWEKYNAITDDDSKLEEAHRILRNLKNIYVEIEKSGYANQKVFKQIFEITRVLDDGGEEYYLDKIAELIDTVKDDDDRIQWLKYLDEQYRLYDNTDARINILLQIYNMDAGEDDAICHLTDLLYTKKKDTKQCMDILNDCINRVDSEAVRVKYQCKIYEILSTLDGESYEKAATIILNRIKKSAFSESDLKPQIVLKILSSMESALDNGNVKAFDGLEKAYSYFKTEDADEKQAYQALKELRELIVNNKYHECIDLMLEDIWTHTIKSKVQNYLDNDIDNVKDAIDNIKQHAPALWNLSKNDFEEIEEIINNRYYASRKNVDKSEGYTHVKNGGYTSINSSTGINNSAGTNNSEWKTENTGKSGRKETSSASSVKKFFKIVKRIAIALVCFYLLGAAIELADYVKDFFDSKKMENKMQAVTESDYDYSENDDNQIVIKTYDISENGTYRVNYTGDIKPGKYTIYGNISSSATIYVCIYRKVDGYANDQLVKQLEVGNYNSSISLQDGDTITVQYRGKGKFGLYMDEKN